MEEGGRPLGTRTSKSPPPEWLVAARSVATRKGPAGAGIRRGYPSQARARLTSPLWNWLGSVRGSMHTMGELREARPTDGTQPVAEPVAEPGRGSLVGGGGGGDEVGGGGVREEGDRVVGGAGGQPVDPKGGAPATHRRVHPLPNATKAPARGEDRIFMIQSTLYIRRRV